MGIIYYVSVGVLDSPIADWQTASAGAPGQKALTSLSREQSAASANSQKALTSLVRGSLRSPLTRNVASL
ncbi:MAG: hypothetical protein V5A27_06445, partial [Halapricum sp.]